MAEHTPSPFECGGSGIADSALNLAQLWQAGFEGESERAAALRRMLVGFARGLAEQWQRESAPVDSSRALLYHRLLWTLRDFPAELDGNSEANPSGLRITMNALRDAFLPDALLALRPAGLATIVARDHLYVLRQRLAGLDMAAGETEPGAPNRFLTVRYPRGEQDNVLMACTAMPYFHQPRLNHVFAASAAGPAYFFAAAAEMQNNKGFSEAFDPPKLCFIGELLEISGWLRHPQVGPLIDRWRAHFGFAPDYLDTHIKSEAALRAMRALQEEYRGRRPLYSPEEYDRDVPELCARLRAGLRPVAARIESTETGATPHVINVLNAGWVFAQLHLDELYAERGCRTADEKVEVRRQLNQLLTQGIAATQSGEPARTSE